MSKMMNGDIHDSIMNMRDVSEAKLYVEITLLENKIEELQKLLRAFALEYYEVYRIVCEEVNNE